MKLSKKPDHRVGRTTPFSAFLREGQSANRSAVLLILIFTFVTLVAPLYLLHKSLSPGPSGAVAVFSYPGSPPSKLLEIVIAADGQIIDTGGWSSVVVAMSTAPDFVDALYRAGAFLVTKPIAVGCLSSQSRGKSDHERE